jgi:hypothetical protein
MAGAYDPLPGTSTQEIRPWQRLFASVTDEAEAQGLVRLGVNRRPNLTPYRLPILTPLSGVAWRQRSSRRSWPGLRRRDERGLRDRRRGF